jgi:hypothetical protein
LFFHLWVGEIQNGEIQRWHLESYNSGTRLWICIYGYVYKNTKDRRRRMKIKGNSLTNSSHFTMVDMIDDPQGLHYDRISQPELQELDKEAWNLSTSGHSNICTNSLGHFAGVIEDEILKGRKSPDSGATRDPWYICDLHVSCYGPFRHKIGFVGDTIDILIAHDPSVLSKEDVLRGLRRCPGMGKLCSQSGGYKCSVKVRDSNLITEREWLLEGFKWTLDCNIQIDSLPQVVWDKLSFPRPGDTYEVDNFRQDISELPESEKQALLGLHLERYIGAHSAWCYETTAITLLLRKMARTRGLCD